MRKAGLATKGCVTRYFVDDLVNVMWARKECSSISYAACRMWRRLTQGRLGLVLNQILCRMIPKVLLPPPPSEDALRTESEPFRPATARTSEDARQEAREEGGLNLAEGQGGTG